MAKLYPPRSAPALYGPPQPVPAKDPVHLDRPWCCPPDASPGRFASGRLSRAGSLIPPVSRSGDKETGTLDEVMFSWRDRREGKARRVASMVRVVAVPPMLHVTRVYYATLACGDSF